MLSLLLSLLTGLLLSLVLVLDGIVVALLGLITVIFCPFSLPPSFQQEFCHTQGLPSYVIDLNNIANYLILFVQLHYRPKTKKIVLLGA
ncbi:MAG: hypothetical protein ACD_45C00023G0001 [uncultured bacterium]|nr:MAG: hypothetical protein ACD_45C00023G0001 [uncultured bacterium]